MVQIVFSHILFQCIISNSHILLCILFHTFQICFVDRTRPYRFVLPSRQSFEFAHIAMGSTVVATNGSVR